MLRKRTLKGLLSRWHKTKPDSLTYSRALWSRQAQKGELAFHKQDQKRQGVGFDANSKFLFEHFGLIREHFRGCTVIDLGAGSKLRTKYFDEAQVIAIEPLADRFLDEVPWCDLNVAHAVYSQPAEHRIEALIGCADLVISINVLDHCYNFYQIISNIRAYLKPDGVAFLSFDEHKYRDSMHPLILSDEICHEVFRDNGLAVSRHTKGFGNVKWIAKGRESYGHGDFCLNYWLSSA